jgi:hypothetical protein
MKKTILLVALTIALGVIASSCTGMRTGYGCPGQGSGLGFAGYR